MMTLGVILFLVGMLGFVFNSKNIILMFISMEMMLLSMTLLMLMSSLYSDDMVGQLFSVYIMSMAGAETAMGLSMLVAYYSLSGTMALDN